MHRCVFEVFNNALAKNEFEILLPKGEQARFVAALMENAKAAQNVTARMDVEQASAYDPDDKAWILEMVRKSVGQRELVSEGGG